METSQTVQPTQPTQPTQPETVPAYDAYGTNEEGNWNVYPSNSNPHGISWGPFPTRTAAIEYMTDMGNPNVFAVNDSDLPDFHNV